jgi:hypothetical protein
MITIMIRVKVTTSVLKINFSLRFIIRGQKYEDNQKTYLVSSCDVRDKINE